MLSFTSVSAMLNTLPGVSSSTNATSAQLMLFAERAESVISAKLAKRYAIPFTATFQPTSILHDIATDLACYKFLTRRVFTSERANKSEWPDRFKESMDLLDEIACGQIPLLDSSGGLIPESGQIVIWSNTMHCRPRYVPACNTTMNSWPGYMSVCESVIDDEDCETDIPCLGMESPGTFFV